MHELTNLDLVIIVLYMIGMLFVGVWFVKRIKNTGDYYVAGRTLGPFVLTATVCASIIGGSAMMGRAGIAYTTGFKAVMTAISSACLSSQASPDAYRRLASPETSTPYRNFSTTGSTALPAVSWLS